MEKEVIYLTDITLHAREQRQTFNYAKAAEKGRMYSPLPIGEVAKSVNTEAHTMRISFEFPPDLQKRVNSGDVLVMVPKDGLMVYAAPDVYEKARQLFGKKINMGRHLARIHKSREKRNR